MKTKIKYPRLGSAENMVRKMWATYKNNKKTFKDIIEEYFSDGYDVDFLFPLLKPYFLRKKQLKALSEEKFITPEGIKISDFEEQKKEELEREERLKRMSKSVQRAGGQQKLWWTEK